MRVSNNLQLVREVVDTLRRRGLDIWLFGGWAEELRGLRPPTPHGDIDLLLRSESFAQLEAFLSAQPTLTEIAAKRFSHKRAFVWLGIPVEILLVQSDSLQTLAFDGRATIDWPTNTFTEPSPSGLPIASTEALALYRRRHGEVVEAYAAYRTAQTSISRA
jgi:predicted nucleotidyltransferase